VVYLGDGGCKAVSENSEVEDTTALVNLHGITPAHGDVRLGFAVEISELTALADRAFGVTRHAQGLEAASPDVAGNEAAMERGAAPGQ
jgi:hypothetical protein